jgi:hypothetical protein
VNDTFTPAYNKKRKPRIWPRVFFMDARNDLPRYVAHNPVKTFLFLVATFFLARHFFL